MLKENTMYRADWKKMFEEAGIGMPFLEQGFVEEGCEYIFFHTASLKAGTTVYDFFGIFGGGPARFLRFTKALIGPLFEVGHMTEVTDMSELAKAYLVL